MIFFMDGSVMTSQEATGLIGDYMPAGQEDSYLVERAISGNRESVDALIRKYQARAYQYAYRLAKDSDEAADVVADSFVRVYRSISGFKGQSSFSTWLYRIITNCYLDRRKRQNARPATSIDDVIETADGEMRQQFVSDVEDALEACSRRKTAETLTSAIAALPESYRHIVTLYHGEMLSYEEMAERLNVPVGTVKSRLNRARMALAERLAHRREDLLTSVSN